MIKLSSSSSLKPEKNISISNTSSLIKKPGMDQRLVGGEAANWRGDWTAGERW